MSYDFKVSCSFNKSSFSFSRFSDFSLTSLSCFSNSYFCSSTLLDYSVNCSCNYFSFSCNFSSNSSTNLDFSDKEAASCSFSLLNSVILPSSSVLTFSNSSALFIIIINKNKGILKILLTLRLLIVGFGKLDRQFIVEIRIRKNELGWLRCLVLIV